MSQAVGGSKESGVNSSPGRLLLNKVTFLQNLQVALCLLDGGLLVKQCVQTFKTLIERRRDGFGQNDPWPETFLHLSPFFPLKENQGRLRFIHQLHCALQGGTNRLLQNAHPIPSLSYVFTYA